jgi:hypothetical protein
MASSDSLEAFLETPRDRPWGVGVAVAVLVEELPPLAAGFRDPRGDSTIIIRVLLGVTTAAIEKERDVYRVGLPNLPVL